MKAVRKRRLTLIGLVLAAVTVAVTLSIFALQRNMTYMFSPTEVDAGKAPAGSQFRLGGIVKEGTVQHVQGTMEVKFVVTDRFHDMPVVYTGILPDLFRQGQSVITTGHMQDGTFMATQVLAKHDETYMPPEVAEDIKRAEKAGRAHAEARYKALKAAQKPPREQAAPASEPDEVFGVIYSGASRMNTTTMHRLIAMSAMVFCLSGTRSTHA